MRTAIVKSKELGINCWLPARFIEGGRCDHVYRCNYPEKSTCKAVVAEIKYLTERKKNIIASTTAEIDSKIESLLRRSNVPTV